MELRASLKGLSGDQEKDMKMPHSYVFQLTEEMRYLMTNLDVTNFNDLGLARYENGRLQVYTEALHVETKKLEIQMKETEAGLEGKITASAPGLEAAFKAADEGLEGKITASAAGLEAAFKAADEGLEGKITASGGLEAAFKAADEGLEGKITASAAGLEAAFKEADKGLEGKITASAESLKADFEKADEGLKTAFEIGIQGVSSTVSSLEETVKGHSASISSITQTASQIQTTVTEQGKSITGLGSDIESQGTKIGNPRKGSSIGPIQHYAERKRDISAIVTGVGEDGKVTAASIVTAINSSGSTVQISADHISLTGYVTVKDMADDTIDTEIGGAYIKSGLIEGTTFRTKGKSWADVEISDGYIEIGSGGIGDDTYGTMFLSDSEVYFETDYGVRIYVGTAGSYWLIDNTGIYWMNYNDRVISTVVTR